MLSQIRCQEVQWSQRCLQSLRHSLNVQFLEVVQMKQVDRWQSQNVKCLKQPMSPFVARVRLKFDVVQHAKGELQSGYVQLPHGYLL